MKRLVITTIALFSLFTFSCKKDNQPHDLFIGATLKNTDWLAQPSTQYLANGDTLLIQGIKGAPLTGTQNLSFKIRFGGAGSYTLTSASQAAYVINMEAGAINIYVLDTTQANTVVINKFDIRTNIAQGSFQLHFIKTSGPGDNTLSFTNGSFWIQTPAVQGQ
ncbi:MAG TPA: DUF6252 family protein [Mucilaginibacter sp.]|jgi:hypothetical protein|nr:DUF6252 family protein [Mucilaginibacter sp.]